MSFQHSLKNSFFTNAFHISDQRKIFCLIQKLSASTLFKRVSWARNEQIAVCFSLSRFEHCFQSAWTKQSILNLNSSKKQKFLRFYFFIKPIDFCYSVIVSFYLVKMWKIMATLFFLPEEHAQIFPATMIKLVWFLAAQ